jgi:primosomal protein N' (replication factor Y)
MKQPFYLRLALPTPLRRLFDYLPTQDVDFSTLKPGIRVSVPFQNRQLVGILVAVVHETTVPYEKLKRAVAVLDHEPVIDTDIYQLCAWAADYYHYSLGETLISALPTHLRKGKPATTKKKYQATALAPDAPLQLNVEQQHAVDTIIAAQNDFSVFLLDGITGSGKTEVYLQVIAVLLAAGKQVLVLVPEISLTPQTIQRFQARFSVPIVALHSGLSEQERLAGWLAARHGIAHIVIGTRSAIFTPLKNIGLIIVDEEHDASFKQQDRFRYHARDLAIMRANQQKIPIILGSATPSLESILNVKRHRYQHMILSERAGRATIPSYQLLDLMRTPAEDGLSLDLLKMIQKTLDAGNQVMLFLNRRGFAPVLYCTECTSIVGCKRCDANMVYHRSPPRLQCHHCDSRLPIPQACGQCKGGGLQPVGVGTQRLEEVLSRHFPQISIIRVDRDSTRRKGSMQGLLDRIHEDKPAILLGTQMLAKGHHFPRVTLVAILDADSGLFSADFRATEQLGQLLLQVAGRAGRAEQAGSVLIQTRHPEHPLLQILLTQGYQAFADLLLKERELAGLPPYTYFAVFRAEAYQQEVANDFLENIKKISKPYTEMIQVLGPVSALIAKKKGLYCQQLVIRAESRARLQPFLKYVLEQIEMAPSVKGVKWVLDVDPIEIG